MSDIVRLTETPKNKSLRALYASVKGDMNQLSSSIPSDISLSSIIEDESISGVNTTVGNDETLFRQFHAWVSGTILYNVHTDSTANGWTYPLPNGTSNIDPFVSMSIQTHTPTRWYSHNARHNWFTHQQGDEFTIFAFLGFDDPPGNYYFDIPDARFPTYTAPVESNYSTLSNANISDQGQYRILWADPYNFVNDIEDTCGATGNENCYSITVTGEISQLATWTVSKTPGGGSGGAD
tara:strand:+ start:8074 stop:8784 length:711 start_codon:yes stop_codon:yes gene_type:complete